MSEAYAQTLYDRLLALPEIAVGEILDGELVVQPRPRPRHGNVSSSLSGFLFSPYRRGVGGPGGWWLIDEPEIHPENQVVVPDLAGWRREHLPRIPDAAYFMLAPDWVCEVLSPSSARYDRGAKQRIYADAAVAWYWIVDPLDRRLEVMENRDGRWAVVGMFTANETAIAQPFIEAPIPLLELWGDT